jgi:hypothetical protein
MTEAQKNAVVRHVEAQKTFAKFNHEYDPEFLKRTKILLLGHTQNQYSGENRDYLEFRLLQDLDLGIYRQYQNNCFSESRMYLSEIPDTEYVGTVTASWNQKFDQNRIDEFHNWENTKVLFNSGDRNIVLTSEKSMFKHDCIFDLFSDKEIVRDFSDFAISLTGEICNFGLWSNQIICHRSIYLKLQEFHRMAFPLVVEKIHSYNLRALKCRILHGQDASNLYFTEGFENRKAGLFFEFLTNVWVSCQKDLIILPNASRKKEWYDNTPK